MLIFCYGQADALTVRMDVIAQIESSNNPKAYNSRTKATGLHQITPICLKDYNIYHKGNTYTMQDMYQPQANKQVASWYINIRIPSMLNHYKHKVTIENVLTAYNWGISNVGKALPKETRDYIDKYNKLTK